MCVCVQVHMCVCTHMCACVWQCVVYTDACVCRCVCVCVHVCKCACLYVASMRTSPASADSHAASAHVLRSTLHILGFRVKGLDPTGVGQNQ